MKYFWSVLAVFVLTACSIEQSGIPIEPADPSAQTIYTNGTILTMDPDFPVAEAIAVRGEKIEAVGTNEVILATADEDTLVIDLAGRTLMPGFVDAHTHLLNDARSQGMSLDRAQATALRNGITTLATLYTNEGFLREISDFNAAGYLRVRTGLYLVATDPCGNKQGDWWKDYPRTNTPGEMLRINGVKIFTDGGSCGGVALSFELEPGWGFGDLWFDQEALDELVAEVHNAGYQAAIHAIGDRAVHQALNAIEAALDGEANTLRHRMEHVSVIDPADIPRFGELGVTPVLVGEFPNCTPYGPPVPEAYGHMEWPWRALRDANPELNIAWHTDVPFQSINPFDHLLGFVTRIDKLGQATCQPAEWLVQHVITVEEALSIMTIQSAHALNRENEVGSLVPGKYADLIVLENNPLEQDGLALTDNRVLLTMVGGRVEYCTTAASDLCPGHRNRPPALLPDTRPPVPVRWLVLIAMITIPLGAMLGRKKLPSGIRTISGVTGVLAGLFWLSAFVLPDWVSDTFFLLVFSLPGFLMAIGMAGWGNVSPPGRLSGLGAWLGLLGAVSFSTAGILGDWFNNDAAWPMLLLGILGHATGLVLLGITHLRARTSTFVGALFILVGLTGGYLPWGLSFILPESSDLPFLLLLGGLGIGWTLLGGLLFRKNN